MIPSRVRSLILVAALVLLISSCRSRAQEPARPEGAAPPSPTEQPAATAPGPSPAQPEATSAPSTTAAKPAFAPPPGPVQGTLEIGKTYKVGSSGKNANIQLTVTGFQLVSAIGGQEAPAGMQYALVSTSWKNLVPPRTVKRPKSTGQTGVVGSQDTETVIEETPYKVPVLAEHVYLYIDGRYLGEVNAVTEQLSDPLPLNSLLIEHYNDEVKGTVAFTVPARMPQSLTLQFFDFTHGDITLPLYGTTPGQERPLAGPVRNQFFDAAAVYRKEFTRQIGGVQAPAGSQFLVIDFGASAVTQSAQAPSTPLSGLSSTERISALDFDQYAFLIEDDVYQSQPITDLAGVPFFLHGTVRFFPGFVRHGVIVFMVPERPGRLELLLAASSMDPLSFVLTPDVQAKRQPQPVRVIQDGTSAEILINSAVRVERLGGVAGPQGRQYVILDVTVWNKEPSQGLIIEPRQFALTDGKAIFAPADVARSLPHPLSGERVVPAGKRARFQLAYEVPAGLQGLRLKYQGYTKIEEVPLP